MFLSVTRLRGADLHHDELRPANRGAEEGPEMDDKTDNTVCFSRRRNNHSLAGADLRGIFSSATDAVFAIDGARRIVYYNKTFADIFPHQASGLSRRQCYEVLCGRTLAGEKLCRPDCSIGNALLKGQPVENFGLSVPRDDEEPLRISVGAIPVSGVFDDVAAIFMLRPIDPSCSLFRPADDRKRTNGDSPDIEHRLTCREWQILKLLAGGLDTRALANALHISHVTARNHIQHIYAKLGIHNRAEAVSYIFRNGLMR